MVDIAVQELISTHIHYITVVAISINESWETIQVEWCRLGCVRVVVEVGVVWRDGIIIADIDAGRDRQQTIVTADPKVVVGIARCAVGVPTTRLDKAWVSVNVVAVARPATLDIAISNQDGAEIIKSL